MLNRLAQVVALAGLVACIVAGCQPLPPETPSARATARRTPRLTPTPDLAAMIVALERPLLLGSYPSPDGAWRAEVHRYECVETEEGQEMALDVLRLVAVQSTEEIVVDRQLQYCGGLGAFGLGGLYWSPGGRYFYYTAAREGGPDGACAPWVRPVSRTDQHGRVETLAGVAPAPDGTMLAGWRTDGSGAAEVVVWEADGGELLRVAATAPDVAVGPIAWAPDGTAVAYLQQQQPCAPTGPTWLARVMLADGASSVVLESEQPGFSDLAWVDAGTLGLSTVSGEQRRLDLTTGTLTTAP